MALRSVPENSATLELGVLDIAYTHDENGKSKGTTTGDVAEILERNYHVMGTFYELKKEKIAGFVADAMANALTDLANGRAVTSPMHDANQRIEALFRDFLDADEMNTLAKRLTGGNISEAAARGVSHRRKQPYKQRPQRPAFVDTGLYRASFRAVFKPGGTFGPMRPNVGYLGLKNLNGLLSDLDIAI